MDAIRVSAEPLTTGEDGVIRVTGTRVTLDSIVAAFDAGATPEEIVQQLPTVDLAMAYATIAYVLMHRREVEDYLAGRSRDAAAVREATEKRFAPNGIRARLAARRRHSA